MIVLFIVIGIIVIIFTRRITKPIQTLTDYTADLKLAEDKQSKEKVVKDVQYDPIFKEISKQYEAHKRLSNDKKSFNDIMKHRDTGHPSALDFLKKSTYFMGDLDEPNMLSSLISRTSNDTK